MPVSFEPTPSGTYGVTFPKLPRALIAGLLALSVRIWRLLGDRVKVQGRPLLLLTTIGAKSGRRREALLGFWPDGSEAWFVVASLGGSARNPGWYLNLAAQPDAWIEVGGRRRQVRAGQLEGAEREEAWQRVVSTAPGYGRYQEKTDREIPILRLSAVTD
jgi:deazaflavin-dependent oxidoreductase (nitroreductase family)